MHRHLKLWVYRLAVVLKFAVTYGLLTFGGLALFVWLSTPHGLNVQFRSSDGNWAWGERLFKGVEFRMIVESFEGYKSSCHAPDAQLQRLTPVPMFASIDWWSSDLGDPKWQVPLLELGPIAQPAMFATPACAGGRLSALERQSVLDRSRAYIADLEGRSSWF